MAPPMFQGVVAKKLGPHLPKTKLGQGLAGACGQVHMDVTGKGCSMLGPES